MVKVKIARHCKEAANARLCVLGFVAVVRAAMRGLLPATPDAAVHCAM